MNSDVDISVCIPAYKNTAFLKRLLDSIQSQTFFDYEIIITDDSPDDSVYQLVQSYTFSLPLKYYRNKRPLGTPNNWNEAIRHATGKWIKIMHDDDWFAVPGALEKFARAAKDNKTSVIFSAYNNVYLDRGKERKIAPNSFRLKQVNKEPVTLLSRNIIGPPSVVLYRNDQQQFYDTALKWLVDIDMYCRLVAENKLVYLSEPLINVGISREQVTASVHDDPSVQIPEHFYFLQKTGIVRLRNILVYDYWWRFFRNFSLFSRADIQQYGYDGSIHPVLLSMMAWEKTIPIKFLKVGFISKIIMTLHYIMHKRYLDNELAYHPEINKNF